MIKRKHKKGDIFLQSIVISHLGPVNNLEMEVKNFNLLIGEQASGKSTVAKAIYFFRIIKDTITDYLCQLYDNAQYNGHSAGEGFNRILKSELKSIFISLFGYSWDLDTRLYLKYVYARNIWIDVCLKKNKKYISVRYSQKLTDEIKKLEKEVLNLHGQKVSDIAVSIAYASKERQYNYNIIRNSVNKIFDDYKETYYIPAGRSMLTLLANSYFNTKSETLDLITRQFIQNITDIRSSFSSGIRNVYTKYPNKNRRFNSRNIANLLIDNLKGDYVYTINQEYIILQDSTSNNDKIPINFASSGQQEVLWLFNLLYVLMLKEEEAFVIIEEPEAHLYTKLQEKIIEFITYFANVNNSAILITTHSPYILITTNLFYCAGKIIKKNKAHINEVYKVVGNGHVIDPDNLMALKLAKNCKIQNLIESELMEIETELIDDVSDDLNNKYVDLFYLDEEQ